MKIRNSVKARVAAFKLVKKFKKFKVSIVRVQITKNGMRGVSHSG